MVDQNLLSQVFDAALKQVNVPVDMMKKADRLELIRVLKGQNAFSFQKSVPYVAERLNISRLTVYGYIKELSKEDSSV